MLMAPFAEMSSRSPTHRSVIYASCLNILWIISSSAFAAKLLADFIDLYNFLSLAILFLFFLIQNCI